MDSKGLQVKEKKEVENRREMTFTGPVFVPSVDILENKDALVLIADMPGVSSDRVEIDLKDNELTISGRSGEEQSDTSPIYTEYKSGAYLRSFTLSSVINQSEIQATMKGGVLRIILPKAEAAKPRKITVSAG